MLGEKKVTDFEFDPQLEGYAIKQPVFSFNKFPNVNKQLGPEMKSTGESILFIDSLKDDEFYNLYAKKDVFDKIKLANLAERIDRMKNLKKESILVFSLVGLAVASRLLPHPPNLTHHRNRAFCSCSFKSGWPFFFLLSFHYRLDFRLKLD